MTQPEQFYGECNVMLSYSFRLMSNKFNQCMCTYMYMFVWMYVMKRYKGIWKENCQKNEHSDMNERVGYIYRLKEKIHNLQHTANEKKKILLHCS